MCRLLEMALRYFHPFHNREPFQVCLSSSTYPSLILTIPEVKGDGQSVDLQVQISLLRLEAKLQGWRTRRT